MSKPTAGPFSVAGPYLDRNGQPRSISILAPLKDTGWATVLAEITVPNLPEGQAEANARLFVAAPDLLEACKRMMREIDDISIGAQEDMIAAIAKAEGRS